MVKRNAGIILPPNDEDLEDSEVESMEDIV